MAAVGQLLVAGLATADVVHVAGDVVAELVAAEAHLGGEEGAGRALGLPVAVVGDRVGACVGAAAFAGTFQRLGAASDWRVFHCGATLAHSFVEAFVNRIDKSFKDS